MLISTIIPVYNAEQYIKRCLDSIINAQIQEVANEIILVDDGSTDNSLAICKEYENRYPNIKVFSQKNQGPSVARNLGLDHATGDWITFVDSDDWVVQNYFKLINDSIKTYPVVDIITFGYFKSTEFVEVKHFQFGKFENIYDHSQVIKLLDNTNENQFLLYPVNKIYSKNLKLKYPVDIRLGEDTLFNLKAFYNANSIIFIKEYIYHYYENKESVTSQKFKPTLIVDMEKHFKFKLSFYQSKEELNNRRYFKDLARVNLEKTFYSFLGNSLAKPNSDFIEELKKIRVTELIKFGFENCTLNDLSGIKNKIVLFLFKYKYYNMLKFIYKR